MIFTARADGRIDLVAHQVRCALGHNDDPPVAGMGSAIFLHVAKPDLLQALALAEAGDAMGIRA